MNTVLFTFLFAPEEVLILFNLPYFVSLKMEAACRREDGTLMWIRALFQAAAGGGGQFKVSQCDGVFVCVCVCVCVCVSECVCVASPRLQLSDCQTTQPYSYYAKTLTLLLKQCVT